MERENAEVKAVSFPKFRKQKVTILGCLHDENKVRFVCSGIV